MTYSEIKCVRAYYSCRYQYLIKFWSHGFNFIQFIFLRYHSYRCWNPEWTKHLWLLDEKCLVGSNPQSKSARRSSRSIENLARKVLSKLFRKFLNIMFFVPQKKNKFHFLSCMAQINNRSLIVNFSGFYYAFTVRWCSLSASSSCKSSLCSSTWRLCSS